MLKLLCLSKLNEYVGQWYVYFLESVETGRSYIGMSNDVARRLRQHNGELVGGAKYTRNGRPWVIKLILGPYETRSIGCKVEWRAKRFRGPERFKYRLWVAELINDATDKDVHLQWKRRRRKRGRKRKNPQQDKL